MSRSYKKTPYAGDHKGKIKKRIANHRVRQKLKNPDFECQHMAYKNVGMDRWDMCDSYSIYSWKKWWEYELKFYEESKYLNKYSWREPKAPDYKEEYRKWYKWHKMK